MTTSVRATVATSNQVKDAFRGSTAKMYATTLAPELSMVYVSSCLLITKLSAIPNNELSTALKFDFIILGAGASGATLARQLLDSEKNWTVLLVEAGGDPQTDSVVPQFFTFNMNNSNVWNHYAQRVNSSSNAFKKGTPMVCGKQL